MRGDINGGIIASLASILPENDIRIPNAIHVNYEEADEGRARIQDGRAIGYFVGDILGLPEDQ